MKTKTLRKIIYLKHFFDKMFIFIEHLTLSFFVAILLSLILCLINLTNDVIYTQIFMGICIPFASFLLYKSYKSENLKLKSLYFFIELGIYIFCLIWVDIIFKIKYEIGAICIILLIFIPSSILIFMFRKD